MTLEIGLNYYLLRAIMDPPTDTVELGLRNLHCAPLQRYRAMLCTIDLCCAPLICVVYHGTHGAPAILISSGFWLAEFLALY